MSINSKESMLLSKLEAALANTLAFQYISHTNRVVDYCSNLGEQERADMSLLIPAAILHDIGRMNDMSLQGHVNESVTISKPILLESEYSIKQVEQILQIISEHHFDLPVQTPTTIEAKVLMDADRLEIVGAFGLTRWFLAIDATHSPEEACSQWLALSKRTIPGRETFFCTKAGEKTGVEGFQYAKHYCLEVVNE
jgi:uncharacterized protein